MVGNGNDGSENEQIANQWMREYENGKKTPKPRMSLTESISSSRS